MKNFYLTLFLLLPSIGYSQNPCPSLDSINYSGQWYHTVQIGNQCWLKENLNIGILTLAVKSQSDNDTIEKFCYNNDPAMCNIYGGLYQWRESMQYSRKIGARGICPIGWHIPSTTEYDTLISEVNGDGNALKKIGEGNGTNISGFSALLSGYNSYTSFDNLTVQSEFWSSNSFFQLHSDPYEGWEFDVWYDQALYSHRYSNSDYGFSVRCLRDTGGISLQSPYSGENWQVGTNHKISWGGDLANKKLKIEYSTNSGINWIQIIDSTPADDGGFNWTIPNSPSTNCKIRITEIDNPYSFSVNDILFTIYSACPGGSTIVYGGKTYQTTLIGNKCWLRENVDIGEMIPGSQVPASNDTIQKYCYNDDPSNCNIYGGLYTISEMKKPGICPTFWHTPTHDELANLSSNVTFDGNALKAYGEGSEFGIGSNTSGFSALLAGIRNDDGTFLYSGTSAWFPVDLITPYKIDMYYLAGNTSLTEFLSNGANPNIGGSVRCIRDDVGLLLLKSPVGGENWLIGSTQKINWTLSNVIVIKIDYTTDNGTSWINIIPSIPTAAGSYNWTIPNTPSTNCKVKITSTNSSDTNSISNVFSIYQIPTNPCPVIPTVNYAGQTYNTISIGDQCWLRENLNIGAMINVTLDQSNNGKVEKYCYNNDTNYCSIYGGLYQWDEAMQYKSPEGSKGLCPSGWHIPSLSDLSILESSVGNNSDALKEVGQGTSSGAGTNSSGFSALLSGISHYGSFYYLNVGGVWWTSTIYDSADTYNLQVASSTNIITSGPVDIMAGYSIRCINDLTISELPVELTTFIATLNDNNISLNWKTATEVNTFSFDIEKKISNNYWQKIASVKASGNSSLPKQYSYIDKNVNTGKYNYRLKMVDLDGSFRYSNIVEVEVVPPLKFELGNAYPNPWNPTTAIRYQVPVNIFVTIKVYDALGREVTSLVNEVKPAGNYEVTLNGRNLSSGIYYYQMRAGNYTITKKIVLIK